jgi:hypothetical protein
MISLILLILAFVLCLIGAWWPFPSSGQPWRPHFGWLGVSCWLLAQILGHGVAR